MFLGIVGYPGFLLSSILLNITPGSDTIYILIRAIVGGRRRGIISALGISTGILIHTLLAAFGLSIILSQSALLFNLMKLAGAAYLVIMGVKALLSRKSLLSAANHAGEESALHTFRQGVLTNALNPKVALFFLALLPQFVSPDNVFGPLPFLILGLTFFATSTIWCVFLALVASYANRLLQKSERAQRVASKSTGVIYILLGLNVLRARLGT